MKILNRMLLLMSEFAEKFIHLGLRSLFNSEVKILKNKGIYLLSDKIDINICNEIIQKFKEHKLLECTTIDETKSDYRIFGFEKIYPECLNIFEKIGFFDVARQFYNTDKIAYTVMVNNTVSNEINSGSGGGWHRDSPVKRQLKAMVYLNDVDENNGCFSYISNTCSSYSKVKDSIRGNFHWRKYRYVDKDINYNWAKKQIFNYVGNAGTVIFFNSKGLHRGIKVNQKERYAMTIYCCRNELPSTVKSMIKI
jgi:hypothetical protein